MLVNKIKTSLWTLAILSGGAFSLAPSVSANTHQASFFKGADIPFAFYVGNHYMPAGKYKLERWTTGSPAYYLKSMETGKSLMVNRMTGNDERHIELVFAKDQTGYVLQKVK
jgi:hypothetical protein